MVQFLDPETAKILQFLDPEIVNMDLLFRERSVIVLAILDLNLLQAVAVCLLVHLDAFTCLLDVDSGESILVVLHFAEVIDFLERVGHFLVKVICTHGIEVVGMNSD